MSTCEINHYHTKSNHCHKRHIFFYMIKIWSLKTETRSILKKQIKLYILLKMYKYWYNGCIFAELQNYFHQETN